MERQFSNVTVMGLGYIGLPTASLLATRGFKVRGVDINEKVVATVNSGNVHITEKDLDQLVAVAVENGTLKAFTQADGADVFLICVPTPFADNHKPDVSYVEAATRSLAPYLKPGNLVILESTSPVGTTEKVAQWLAEERSDLTIPLNETQFSGNNIAEQIYIAHCPERVLPGRTLQELIENDRIIGGINHLSAEKAEVFYQQFVTGGFLITNARTAELSKLSENAFRDVNIAFANELAQICEALNINVWELIRLANRHPRVNILQPGPGVGGHCIAVDPWFIVDSAPQKAKLIKLARETNDARPHEVVSKVKKIAEKIKNPIIACLGLSYKANIDDYRESPALHITQMLAAESVGQLLIVEPYIKSLPHVLTKYSEVLMSDLKTALQEADILLLLVDHQEFIAVDRQQLHEKMIVDTRGIWQ